MAVAGSIRSLLATGLWMACTASAQAATPSEPTTATSKIDAPIVAAAEGTGLKSAAAERNVLRADEAGAGFDVEPLTVLLTGLGVGLLLLLRRSER
jgi:hypothetical protein